MDYITDPLLLLLVIPHALWIGGFYHYHMYRHANVKSLTLPSPPPVVPKQDDTYDAFARLIFSPIGWRWAEAAERARLGFINKLTATCL